MLYIEDVRVVYFFFLFMNFSISNSLSKTVSNPLQTLKIGLLGVTGFIVLFFSLGLLNVLESVPLLSPLLNLIALYYLYNDRARVSKLITRSYDSIRKSEDSDSPQNDANV